jgi:prepilin-type N-terminal cleavage/methylation domain-containing protein
MRRAKGFSLIELLIVVAIILIIAAIGVPSFLNSRMAANESSAVSSLRTLNTAQISYNTTYATVGFAANLTALAGTCTGSNIPTSSNACLIDSVLESGIKSGYSFTLQGVSGSPASSYQVIAAPLNSMTGVHSFCSFEDALIRVSQTVIATCDSTVPEQQ